MRCIARQHCTGTGSWHTAYCHQDHLGSTRVLTGASGEEGSFTYDPFGNVLVSTGGAQDHNHRFTGKPMQDTGLYYYGARFYDPTLGRFISSDPAMDGLNWWIYVRNNPLKYVDPDGQVATPALALAGTVIGSAYGVTSTNGLCCKH